MLYTQTPAKGLANDDRFPKPGPSHHQELMQQMVSQEEHAKLTKHLQLSRDRRMSGPISGASRDAEHLRSLYQSPLAGLSSGSSMYGNSTTSQWGWPRKDGRNLRGAPGSSVRVNMPPKSSPSLNLRGSLKR